MCPVSKGINASKGINGNHQLRASIMTQPLTVSAGTKIRLHDFAPPVMLPVRQRKKTSAREFKKLTTASRDLPTYLPTYLPTAFMLKTAVLYCLYCKGWTQQGKTAPYAP